MDAEATKRPHSPALLEENSPMKKIKEEEMKVSTGYLFIGYVCIYLVYDVCGYDACTLSFLLSSSRMQLKSYS